MKSYQDIIKNSEIIMDLPVLEKTYNGWHENTKAMLYNVWEEVANYQLMKFATDIHFELLDKDYQKQILYLSFLRTYMNEFINHPQDTLLASDKTSDEIIKLLKDKNIDIKFPNLIINKFDLFLYLDTHFIESCSGKNLNLPFMLSVKYSEDLSDNRFFKLVKYNNLNLLYLNKNKDGEEIPLAIKKVEEEIASHCYVNNEFL